jgi:hypothetical protein
MSTRHAEILGGCGRLFFPILLLVGEEIHEKKIGRQSFSLIRQTEWIHYGRQAEQGTPSRDWLRYRRFNPLLLR